MEKRTIGRLDTYSPKCTVQKTNMIVTRRNCAQQDYRPSLAALVSSCGPKPALGRPRGETAAASKKPWGAKTATSSRPRESNPSLRDLEKGCTAPVPINILMTLGLTSPRGELQHVIYTCAGSLATLNVCVRRSHSSAGTPMQTCPKSFALLVPNPAQTKGPFRIIFWHRRLMGFE